MRVLYDVKTEAEERAEHRERKATLPIQMP